MNKIIINIFILSNLLLFFGCEESTIPKEETGTKFLPLKIGNYWIYNSYDKDYNNSIIYSSHTIDSVIIEHSDDIMGNTAYFLVKYRNDKPIDTLVFSYKDGNIYLLFDSNSVPVPGLKSTWFPIINFETQMNGSWNVFKTLINDYNFFDDDVLYKGNYWHTINGEYVYIDSMDFEGKRFLTKSFINKYDSKLEFTKLYWINETSYDTLIVTRFMKFYDKYQVVEGIGLFKMQRDSYLISTTTEPSSTFEKVEYVKGYESLLKKYYIKF